MTTIGRLDSFFTSLINDLMALERQPLYRMQEQRDTVNVRRGAYLDLKTKLDELQDSARALISTDPFSLVKTGRSASISNTASETTVLTASAGSGAVAGNYQVAVTQLAQAQSRVSAVQSSVDLALGLSGTFWLGGTGTASASVTPNATVTGVSTASLAEGQRELGTGTYYLETRQEGGVLQFRLKDVDGQVVSIYDREQADGSFTTAWQDVAAGSYDTGRGLVVNFSGSGSDASTSISYTAAGVSVSVETADSLIEIASKINDAAQPVGRDLTATVVGKQLVLTAAHTGTAHAMIYTDSVGLGFTGEDLQLAEDALFSVNGIGFTRSGNTALTDVIYGVTLNLAADAEGNSATLTVSEDISGVREAIEAFIEKFNAVQIYLESKTSLASVNSGENVTYVRGTLSSDTVFSDLRTDLFSRFMAITPNSGIYESLYEIGLTIDSSLTATISDADKLNEALENHLEDVASLLDAVMANLDTTLSRFTGATSGYIDRALDSFDEQIADLESDIQEESTRLDEKEVSLALQFAGMQAQLMNLSYMQQIWSGIYGNVNRLY